MGYSTASEMIAGHGMTDIRSWFQKDDEYVSAVRLFRVHEATKAGFGINMRMESILNATRRCVSHNGSSQKICQPQWENQNMIIPYVLPNPDLKLAISNT